MSASIRLKAVATSRPNDFEIKAYVPITLLRITPESRTLDQLHAENRDVKAMHTRPWAGENSQAVRGFLLVPPGEKAHICDMTTTTRPGGLCGWSIWCASVAISLAFCASAFAGVNSGVSQPKKPQSAQKSMRKVCYAHSSCSSIPQPCNRIFGPIPTTASPLDIIRR